MTYNADKLIETRAPTHGEFNENAGMTWEFMRLVQRGASWAAMNDGQRHALYMILHKVSRIAAGNPHYEDHWADLAGYAELVRQRLPKPPAPPTSMVTSVVTLSQNANGSLSIEGASQVVNRTDRALYVKDQFADHANATVLPPTAIPPGTPEDGGHHARGNLDFGGIRARLNLYDGATVCPEFENLAVTQDGVTYYLVDRNHYSNGAIEHLPKLILRINHSEYTDVLSYYKPLYNKQDEGLYYELGFEWSNWAKD